MRKMKSGFRRRSFTRSNDLSNTRFNRVIGMVTNERTDAPKIRTHGDHIPVRTFSLDTSLLGPLLVVVRHRTILLYTGLYQVGRRKTTCTPRGVPEGTAVTRIGGREGATFPGMV
jgi:hypothetical protein